MAKYTVTESDMTRVSTVQNDTSNFVFVPINSTWGPYEEGEYVEINSLAQLQETFGGDAEADDESVGVLTSYQYAAGVLRNGFSVLAKRVVDDNAKCAYGVHTDVGQTQEFSKIKTTVNGHEFGVGIRVENNTSEESINAYGLKAKYPGTFANNFEIIATTKFVASKKMGLYINIKKDNVTIEENLIGVLSAKSETSGEGTVWTLEFDKSLSLSSEYVDFGKIDFKEFPETGEPEFAAGTLIKIGWSSAASATSTVVTLPFAKISDHKGVNTTRTNAEIKVRTNYIASSSSGGAGAFVKALKDKWSYDIKFISNGGYQEEKTDTPSIAEGMIEIADERQDCIAFIDAPTGCETVAQVEGFGKAITSKSSYAAMYSPWCRAIPYGSTKTVLVPASYLVLTSFAKSFSNGNSICDVPAGVNRGSVNIQSPTIVIGGPTQEEWQSGADGNLGFCINPIMNIRKYGYCIFGQRNLLELPYGVTSALQEIGVRVTLNEIKKWVRDVALSLTFESNSSRTWNEFTSRTQQCLDKLVMGGYLTDYTIMRGETETGKENTLNATIQVYVTRALENFNINIEVYSGEVNFTEETT